MTSQINSRFLPHSRVEIIRPLNLDHPPEHVLFDFDGTLSLIREGWPGVMIPMMVEILSETATSESSKELHKIVEDFVLRLNGKQTIYQMIQLAEEVKKRDGLPRDPQFYKDMYHQRLLGKIRSRREGLRDGTIERSEMLVPRALEFLAALREKGVNLYLASGTDQKYVIEEAALLGLVEYFGEHIYGAVDDFRTFSKQIVIEKILQENGIDGNCLLGIGDGYVEIQNIKTAGGTAIAVASDESGRSGKPDPWKRERLIGVGADIVIPDFQDHEILLQYLFGN
jgi:phosphoglycolate phosphatase-like HAD superfamily hydrolase